MRKYDSYKDSGIEWIGEIPSHWAIATIGRLSNLGRGRVISAIEIAENEGEYPVYSSQTENNGVMGRLNSFDFEGEYVTWTTDGANAGTVFYREGKFNCTNVCGTIQPKNWEQIDLKFLPYYLNLGTKFSVRLDINPKLMNNMMAKIPLVIPPKKEQTAIAHYLDRKTAEIDELIADKKRLLELYEEEKTAIINQAVTKGINPDVPMKDSGIEWLGEIPEHWEVSLLKRFCKVTDGSHYSPKTQEFGLPYVSVKDVGENSIDLINCKKISVEDFDALTKNGCKPKEGDVLLTKDGTIGRAAIVTSDHEPFVILSSLGLITPNEKLIAKYLYYYLISGLNIDQMYSFIHGSALTRLTIEKINNLNITIPPIDEQGEIVNQIESKCSVVNSKKAKTEKLIELLTEYRTALISEVVTGKIKVIE